LPEFAYIRLSKKRIMIKNLVFDFGGIIADFEFSRALAAFERVGLKNPAEYVDSYTSAGSSASSKAAGSGPMNSSGGWASAPVGR